MKTIIIVKGTNYPILYAVERSNSFGDQVIDFVHESKNGTIKGCSHIMPEGEWLDTTVDVLFPLWLAINRKTKK